ncbi:MAG: hypothetical protein MJA29_12820, partial [Candidatus Omnitrophica bacterium]|nr:hypothetical protein [Candidatus Omnitrophota bacterium]
FSGNRSLRYIGAQALNIQHRRLRCLPDNNTALAVDTRRLPRRPGENIKGDTLGDIVAQADMHWSMGNLLSADWLSPDHMFDLGYARDDFHNACYCARHLLSLPVHPAVNRRHLDMMTEIILEKL